MGRQIGQRLISLVIILFGLFAWRGYSIALRSKDRFASLVVFGITSHVILQVLMNLAVVTNTIPSTGISLPFFSHGGTSLIILLLEMGVILAISRFSYEDGTEKNELPAKREDALADHNSDRTEAIA